MLRNSSTLQLPLHQVSLYVKCIGFFASQILTMTGNFLVILSFYCERRLRKPKHLFILSLAAADFIIGIFSMPIYSLYLVIGYWPLGSLACDIWLSIDYACCEVSVLNLIMISVDRLWAVKYPLKYRRKMNSFTAIVMIIPTWTLPFILYFTSIVGWPHFAKHKNPRPSTECYVSFLTDSPLFLTLSTVCVYWLPVFALFIIYAYIYNAITQLNRRNERLNGGINGRRRISRGQVTARKTLGFILGAFFLTWSPYSVIVIILAYRPDTIPISVYHFTYFLCYINSTMNPFCYALSNRLFRQTFRALLIKK